MQELLTALQDSPVAETFRFWRWAYPLASVGHIFGVALLFGAILPLDLRLLGIWPSIPIAVLARVLVPVAGAGLGLTLVTGPLLFTVDPLVYAELWLFQLKLLLIAAAVVNLGLVHRSRAWRRALATVRRTPPPGLRLAGLCSAGLWLLVVLCGRFLAYV